MKNEPKEVNDSAQTKNQSELRDAACYACGSYAKAVFSQIAPIGYYCPDCGVPDRASVACIWEKSSFDNKKYCYCKDELMDICDYRESVDGMTSMCIHNLDKSQPKGSSAEITDFCFHSRARSYSLRNSKVNDYLKNK